MDDNEKEAVLSFLTFAKYCVAAILVASGVLASDMLL
jgi:hypothetical protein